MITIKFLLCLYFVFIGLNTAITNLSSAVWKTEFVDDAKEFSVFYSRAISVDTKGYSHIVYGGDHLYHAYHTGIAWNYDTVDL